MNYHGTTKVSRTENRNKTKELYPKHIHIFRPLHKHIRMFHKVLYKTLGAFALKGTTYIETLMILIALKGKNAGKK